MGCWWVGGGCCWFCTVLTSPHPNHLNTILSVTARNVRPARPPTTMPMIVDVDSLPSPEDAPCESEVVEAVGPPPTPPPIVLVKVPGLVAVACTVAGFAAGLYPFSAQYCA